MEIRIGRKKLAQWVSLYTKDLYAWAYRKTDDRQLSQDLVQDTFLAAMEGLSGFKGESQPKTWLLAILRNKIAAHYRKSIPIKVSSLSDEQMPSLFNAKDRWIKGMMSPTWNAEPEDLLDNPDFNIVFENCIKSLPADMKSCIRLKFLDRKKGAYICQELGISASNYWQLIHRAKLHLKRCLDKDWFGVS